MSPMPDALSAAGLLLAAIALVYSAWSGSIDAEAKRTYSAHAGAKAEQQVETKRVLNGRARPIMIVCWLVFVTFLPRSLGILWDTGECVVSYSATCTYDDVATVLVLTEFVVAGLALHLTQIASTLRRKVGS